MTPEQLEQVREYAKYGFTIQRIARLMELDPKELQQEYEDENSALRAKYEQGWLEAELDRKKAKQEAASKGNLTAIQMIEKDAKTEYLKRRKEEIFGRPMES
jgi:DNA-binding transcriptional MerR regulator